MNAFDPTLIIEIIKTAAIVGAGLIFLMKVNSSFTGLKNDVSLMQREIVKISDVLTKLAVTESRLTNIESDIRELRHGQGFVQGPRGIDHEYK